MPEDKSPKQLITACVFFAFFLFGFTDNMKGPALPALLQDLNFNYAQGGTILLGAYAGFLVATLLTGALSDTIGKKTVIIIAGIALLSGITGYSSFSSFLALITAMAVIGLGLGSLEVGANTIIVDLYSQDRGRYLNMLAFFHGVGSMAAPIYAGQLLTADLSWRSIYRLSLILVTLLLIFILLVRYPKKTQASENRIALKTLGRSLFSGDMLLFFFFITVYVAAEIGMASWIVEFLKKAKSHSIMLSSIYLSLFFGGITLGRFLGSFWVYRIGYLKTMLLASAGSIITVSIGIFGPPVLVFFLPFTGIFFSIMFPTVTAAVSDLHRENVGTLLGILFTFAGLGGALGPWAIGLSCHSLGIARGFGMILFFCFAMFGALLLLMRRKLRFASRSSVSTP